jgi:putative oxidoreductase
VFIFRAVFCRDENARVGALCDPRLVTSSERSEDRESGPANRAVPGWLVRADHTLIELLRRHSVRMLRWALGVVFVWFGVLKVIGRSPVAGLVSQTLPWLPADAAVKSLGVVEVIIGLGLITGLVLRIILLFFLFQMIGTFGIFIAVPEKAFSHSNPLLLTTTGEFVIKNLVLIAAGLAVAATIPKVDRSTGIPQMLSQRPRDPQ